MRCDQAIFQVVISSSSLTLAARIPTAVLKLDLEPHGDLLDVEPRRVPVEADAPAGIARFCLGELTVPALSEVSTDCVGRRYGGTLQRTPDVRGDRAAHAWQCERRQTMTLTRKDAAATGLTGLAALAFLATHEGWNVPLVGESHRWAAAVVMALGIGACSMGAKRVNSVLFGILGFAAFVFGMLALVTGSLTPLSLLVADMMVMWALTTFRHAHSPPRRPVAT